MYVVIIQRRKLVVMYVNICEERNLNKAAAAAAAVALAMTVAMERPFLLESLVVVRLQPPHEYVNFRRAVLERDLASPNSVSALCVYMYLYIKDTSSFSLAVCIFLFYYAIFLFYFLFGCVRWVSLVRVHRKT